jgi:Zn-dependent protease/CBS domain-containing protein
MFSRAVRLARVRGIDVRLDPSLVLIALLVGWTFGTRFAAVHPLPTAVAMAAAGAVLFFASILAHELAHAFEAMHRGLEVHGITLFLFGGVTEMDARSESPRDEFVIAAVGPYVSLLCGAAFGLLATYAGWLFPAGVARPIADVAGLLGWLNVLLAVFNLVPGAPLDGGRVLRAGLWFVLRDRRRALRISARMGQLLGAALVAFGIWGVSQAGTAGLVGGFWWLVIGFFLYSAARSELRQSDVEAVLHGRRARDLIGPLPDPVATDRPLDTLDAVGASGGRDLVAVADDDRLVGVLDVHALTELHPTDRSLRSAGEVMTPLDDLPRVELDAGVRELIAAFAGDHRWVAIARDGQLVGVVTEREVARRLEALRDGSGRSGRRARRRTASGHPDHVGTGDPGGRP